MGRIVDDGFATEEKLALLLKKNQGLPSTSDAYGVPMDAGLEPVRYQGRPMVMPQQIWGDQVPTEAPADLSGDPEMLLDDAGAALAGSFLGRASAQYPYLRRFYRVPMQQVFPNTTNYLSWTLTSPSGGDVLLQRAIPMSFHATYMYRVEFRAGGRFYPLVYGASGGQWTIDSDTGILTFYDFPQVERKISRDSVPYVSFYRYEGRVGFPFNGGGADLEGTGLTGVQGQVVFNGGDQTPQQAGDALAAVKVDDRDPALLPPDTFTQALQMGGDFDGAWRMVIRGGGGPGTGDQTTLEIQNRRDGTWHTQFRFNDQERLRGALLQG